MSFSTDEEVVDSTRQQLAPLCHWYIISRDQRRQEMHRLEGTRGTQRFKQIGCYGCNGYNKECDAYEPFGGDVK